MKKVITYGTFDLLHNGHINLLKRAKALGDYLIVGVTSENYDISRGKLNVSESVLDRIENVRNTGLADEIIIEEYLGQKVNDIKKYNIDIFAIGSDWTNQFDYLKPFCDVVYLPRTQGVSSTDLRNKQNNILKLGIVGNGRIAKRFVKESKYVSGVSIDHVYGRNEQHLEDFSHHFGLKNYYTDYSVFLNEVDAVYIAYPHLYHYEFAKNALVAGKHVLCEKPAALNSIKLKELIEIANKNKLVFMEAIKTAYSPGFEQLINVALSGVIGEIKDIDATFTKLITDKTLREFNKDLCGGSFTELSSYPLLIILKLLGTNPKSIDYITNYDNETGVDLMTKALLQYKNAIATANVALGIKKEGCCVISGTKGYIYVPAPWWKTEYFEVRFENLNEKQIFFNKFAGDGLRYELAEFLKMINNKKKTYKLTEEESIFISQVIEDFLKGKNVKTIGEDIIYGK